ncbi:hypothetical protein PUNSTDRAFT_115311 [Punctularia strigosozonata HHB-11173 SS5]|uniref:uncharacterized protein n=1 Tax=Punctularia strigosozonata (strain HHB-11173) TaxID=741275 RepID=UPI00044176C8|nr:uncharacterized protein PUNSTDRAFT_115311 [Punctularia strigosozonata HHB-11173 SS5]EIN06843.1 hypothetical protein PUNSTDRAFT_115311 [Punctularia strigosozonata HHB-11173 SS5]
MTNVETPKAVPSQFSGPIWPSTLQHRPLQPAIDSFDSMNDCETRSAELNTEQQSWRECAKQSTSPPVSLTS